MNKGIPAVWRDAVRDSELDKAAKVVGFVLSTYLNANGRAFPALQTLADGASISLRTVYLAIKRLERDGFISVTRSRGRRSHRYQVTLPGTSTPLHGSEWATAQLSALNHAMASSNPAATASESALKRGKAAAGADGLKAAASAKGKKSSGDENPMPRLEKVEEPRRPFLAGQMARAFGAPYWHLITVIEKSPYSEAKEKWTGVFNSLEAAEAERDRLEGLGHVNGDYLEVREGTPQLAAVEDAA